MICTNYSNLRSNLKSYCDSVTDQGETLLVTRKANKNVVIISFDEFNALAKQAANSVYLQKIDAGLAQHAAGLMKNHDLIEVDDNE